MICFEVKELLHAQWIISFSTDYLKVQNILIDELIFNIEWEKFDKSFCTVITNLFQFIRKLNESILNDRQAFIQGGFRVKRVAYNEFNQKTLHGAFVL